MSIKRFFVSIWFYYFLIVLGLLIFIFAYLPYLMQNQVISSSLGENLFVESWGILFTVLLLTIGIELRERLRWKPLKKKISKNIGEKIRSLFLDLKPLVKTSKDTKISTDKEKLADKVNRMISTTLNELEGKEQIELSEWGEDALTEKRNINQYINMFREARQSLIDLEIMSEILKEPKINECIMDIQKNLELLIWLVRDGDLRRENGKEKDAYFKYVSEAIHRIIKEICRLEKLEIDIYL